MRSGSATAAPLKILAFGTSLTQGYGLPPGTEFTAVLQTSGVLGAYVHGVRIGALVALEGGTAALAHDLAMHVAASNPRYISVADVPAEVEWFRNLDNPHTERAYRNAIADFMRFTGIRR